MPRRETKEKSSTPFKHENGRRYLRGSANPYPLPVDLAEHHRQALRTLMLVRLYGAPFCNPIFGKHSSPKKVLELACGDAFWSSACHEYFKNLKHDDISFTGVDVVPLAPGLRQTGMNWKFVQHDLRIFPLPFEDGEFDLVMLKDSGFAKATIVSSVKESHLEELTRLLRAGGVLEFWESDHVIRTILPNPPAPTGVNKDILEQAEENGAYTISPATAFAPSQNKFIKEYNEWVADALEERKLAACPCTVISWAFNLAPDLFERCGTRRHALPFSSMRWEHEANKAPLNADQASVRHTALLNFLQFVAGLEPMLKTESGKSQDDWDRWLAAFNLDLLEQKGTINGECLEVGAYWGVKS